MAILISDTSAVTDNPDGTKTTTRSVINGTPEAAGQSPEGVKDPVVSAPSAPPSEDHMKLRPTPIRTDGGDKEIKR